MHNMLVEVKTKAGVKPVDLLTMRRWRTGALAVDNSGELPTALPVDHKLHRLRRPVPLQKIANQTRPYRCGVRLAQTGLSTFIADSWGMIESVTQGSCTGCSPSMECALA
ncbi:MAG: hypothetical protein KAX57_02190 [Rhodoferax sp.]|nr:hypothetical protein [Rhodoferax sp.]